MGVVATVTVDIGLCNPILHGVNHCILQFCGIVVQLCYVFPFSVLGRVDNIAISVFLVPVGMIGNPGMVPCRVVGNPVKHYLHSLVVGCFNQCFYVCE